MERPKSKNPVQYHTTPVCKINGVTYRVSNTSLCGYWYVTNGAEHPDTRYLWGTDLQWHTVTSGERPEDCVIPYVDWPGYFTTEDKARETVLKAQEAYPDEHKGQRKTKS